MISGSKIYEKNQINIFYSLGKKPTLSQKNALKKVKQYLDTMAFSKKKLIEQLEFEGFTNAQAIHGVSKKGL